MADETKCGNDEAAHCGENEAACPEHQQCVQQAQALGIGGPVVSQLLTMFGPLVVQALLNLLQKKQQIQQLAAQRAQSPAPQGVEQPQAWGLDLSMVTNLTAILLLQHRTDILGWLSQAEAQLLDTIIAKLQGSAAPV